MYTDKVIFKGTPAQFYAVFQEFSMSMSDQSLFYINNTLPNMPSGRNDRPPIPNVVADTARVMIVCFTEKEGIEFRLTAVITFDGKTQITCWSRDEQEFEKVQSVWKCFLVYAGNWRCDDGYEKLPEPEDWLTYLKNQGITLESNEGKQLVSFLVKRYWNEKGKNLLPVRGRLEKCLSVGKTWIYDNLDIGKEYD